MDKDFGKSNIKQAQAMAIFWHEQERIKELAFWNDVPELTTKMPFHVHPIALVGNTEVESQHVTIINLSKTEFVETIYKAAQEEEARSGVPAAITTAQAILETGYGKEVPRDIDTGNYSYNLFGIKAHGNPSYVTCWTHEVINGKRIKIKDKFMAYNSFQESIKGRTEFFLKNKRYHFLFKSSDSNDWADGLQSAGYATDPNYSRILKSIIKMWNLN